jgi:signal transduction histidine kinase
MSQLIDDLLAYSRVGRRELSHTRLSLRTAVQRVCREREHDLKAHRVQVIDETADIEIEVDLECLLQILRNLIDNAVKFSRDAAAPELRLHTDVRAGRVVFSVRDNGCGFDMKYHDRIFTIFQRLHRTSDYPGTGVGLAIVSKAAERLGGRVWAHSQPGEGAEFFLELPYDPSRPAH